jgi:hypothetical protein
LEGLRSFGREREGEREKAVLCIFNIQRRRSGRWKRERGF